MRSLLAAVVAAASALAAAPPVSAAPLEDVSIHLRQYRNENLVFTLAFSGRIASGEANERVDLLVKECGYDHFRVVGGALTTTGGHWAIELPRSIGSFRARWNGRSSDVVQVRMPIHVWASKVPGRRAWRVAVPRGAGAVMQDMHGRMVELQRRTSSGRWVRVRQARLRATFTSYEAVFPVPTRGLTLRAVVPSRSAAPCYTANATAPWRS
ncbi:MAG TPA: hypothetical protein VM290_03295 [Gaiellaceae bacterium]|nr:hypothetical protein [Gaiellaceae bacterium]